MTASDVVRTDERIEGIKASAEAIMGRILSFGLLADIMYRSWRYHDAAWDLWGLLMLGGAAAGVHQLRRHGFGPRSGRILIASMILAAVVASLSVLVLKWLR